MEDKIQAFRQPMVTATGIILGFMLNFALKRLFIFSIGVSFLGALIDMSSHILQS